MSHNGETNYLINSRVERFIQKSAQTPLFLHTGDNLFRSFLIIILIVLR